MHKYCIFLCFEKYTPHTLIYNSHFSTLEKSEWCDAIIDNISYEPICVMEGKYRKRKSALENILSTLFDENCIVEYVFKVTVHDFS